MVIKILGLEEVKEQIEVGINNIYRIDIS